MKITADLQLEKGDASYLKDLLSKAMHLANYNEEAIDANLRQVDEQLQRLISMAFEKGRIYESTTSGLEER